MVVHTRVEGYNMRREGNSKLVYDKRRRTIVTVRRSRLARLRASIMKRFAKTLDYLARH